jgi:uncharacterized protein DUF4231
MACCEGGAGNDTRIMADIIGTLHEVGLKLFGLRESLSRARHERKQQVVDLFSSIAKNIEAASASLKQGIDPHGICQTLLLHSQQMGQAIGDLVGEPQATELGSQLREVLETGQLHAELGSKPPEEKQRSLHVLDQAAGLFKATADFLNNDKDKYFKDLRDQKEQYVGKALKHYQGRIKPFRWGFRIMGGLIILGSVSLPFLAQTTAKKIPWVISAVSLGVALLTALNSFFGWHLTWQKAVAVTAALEHYIACWELDLVKAYRESYDAAKQQAYLHTSYLFTQVFTTVSGESEAFFAQLKLPEQGSQESRDRKAPQ